jgi:tRNA threonylcarbamoyladenosine biosynthesis protein TsaB
MRVLAVDAATEACSAALNIDGEYRARTALSGRSSAQQILKLVEELLAEAELSLTSLDGIAASIGPGAFTGVRISVAVAQGLAFGADLTVIPITTLEALALQVSATAPGLIVSCLDARMGEVYWGCFAADAAQLLVEKGAQAVAAPHVLSNVASHGPPPYAGIGRGFSAYPRLLSLPGLRISEAQSLALPNAREMAQLGALRLAQGRGLDPAKLTPLYLRDKVALTEAERAAQSP